MRERHFGVLASVLLIAFMFLPLTSITYSAYFVLTNSENFSQGTYSNTEYNSTGIMLQYLSSNLQNLPDNGTTNLGINMSGNVLMYHFDINDGSTGVTIPDSSPGNNNGTLQLGAGGQNATYPSLMNKSISFDGTNDYITIPNSQTLNITGNETTVMMWINSSEGSSGYDGIGSKFTVLNEDPYVRYSFYRQAGSASVNFAISTGGVGTLKSVLSESRINLSKWIHLTGVYNSTHLTLYFNGAFNNEFPATGNLVTSSEVFQIGANAFSGAYFEGTIDEFAIFNRSLSQLEIQRIFQRQQGPYGGGIQGNYSSQLFDAGLSSNWTNLSWTPEVCYGCEMPSNRGVETGYVSNLNMSDNLLLLHMNETSGNILDYSGYGNNGTVYGSVVRGDNGIFGTGIRFERNSSGYLNFTNNSRFNVDGTQLTVATWIYINGDPIPASSDAQRIITKPVAGETSPYASYILYREGNGVDDRFGFLISTGGAGFFSVVVSKDGILPNTWYHVAGVYNGSHLNMYINGELDNSVAGPGTPIVPTSTDLIIGADSLGSQYLNATLDEVGIWNRSLTASELLNLYKRGVLRLNLTVQTCDDVACVDDSILDISENTTEIFAFNSSRYFRFYAYFDSNNSKYTPQIYNLTIHYLPVRVYPTFTIQFPSNGSNYSSNSVALNFVTDGTADGCWYNLDGGSNITLANCANTTISPGFGLHTINISVNSTSGDINSSGILNFTVDVYKPLLSIQSPTNNSNFTGSVAFNYIVSENLTSATCSYSLDGAANNTLSNCANTTKSPADGRHTIIFFANDTVGNLNVSTQINFTVDSTAPTLSVESPINNTQYNTSSVAFDFTVSDALFGVETCVYSLNGAANTSLSSCANTTLTLADGVYNVTFYSNDTGGNLRINGMYFFNVSTASAPPSSSSDDEFDEIRSQEISVDVEFTDDLLRISVELDGEPTEADVSLLLVDPYSGEVFEGSTDRNGVLEVPLSELEFGSYEAVVRVRGHAPVTEEFEYIILEREDEMQEQSVQEPVEQEAVDVPLEPEDENILPLESEEVPSMEEVPSDGNIPVENTTLREEVQVLFGQVKDSFKMVKNFSNPDVQKALQIYEQAKKAFDAGDYENATTLARTALILSEHVNSSPNVSVPETPGVVPFPSKGDSTWQYLLGIIVVAAVVATGYLFYNKK